MTVIVLVSVGALVLTMILTGVARSRALARGTLDVPNARSSHTVPTPRGGGIAIVVSVLAAVFYAAFTGLVDQRFLLATLGGFAVAWVGHIDDTRPVTPMVRLAVHFMAAGWAVYWLGGLPPIRVGEVTVTWGAGGYLLGVLAIVWTLNLFNFMDGIDGIAAAEAAFLGLAAGSVHLALGQQGLALVCASLAASCLGFLRWNWSPARIFMGDVGSGFLGFFIAVLAIRSSAEHGSLSWAWLILGAAFFVDASVTLVRRLWRREKVYQAHRTHAYQWLSRRWKSHGRVVLAMLAANLFWLLPCALMTLRRPDLASWIVLVALIPLAFAVLAAGAGRKEQ